MIFVCVYPTLQIFINIHFRDIFMVKAGYMGCLIGGLAMLVNTSAGAMDLARLDKIKAGLRGNHDDLHKAVVLAITTGCEDQETLHAVIVALYEAGQSANAAYLVPYLKDKEQAFGVGEEILKRKNHRLAYGIFADLGGEYLSRGADLFEESGNPMNARRLRGRDSYTDKEERLDYGCGCFNK